MKPSVVVAAVALLSAGLAGCVVPPTTLSEDFGSALNENLVAQIADPDARYTGDPAPGSTGTRVGLAQERYSTGQVIKPTPATASTIGAQGGSAPPAAPTQ